MDRTRQLTLQEHESAIRIYNRMAEIFANKTNADHPPVLARNRYVEVAIIELAEAIGDNELLLATWKVWVEGRELDGLTWPVTKFQQEYIGLLSAGRDEIKIAKHNAALQAHYRKTVVAR